MSFDLNTGAFLYCLLVVGFFLVAWLYYDRRDHALYEAERRKAVFHCIRCDKLYTAKRGTELCPCPRCSHNNTPLKF